MKEIQNKKSLYPVVKGFFISTLLLSAFLSVPGCSEKPKEVLQTLEDGTVIRRHYEIHGKKEGMMTDYYQNGIVKGERLFIHDIQEGRSVWYYPDGTKKESQEFINGKQTGVDTMWMEDGSLQRVIHYKDGRKHGPMRAWSETGELILEVIFENDSLVTVNKSPSPSDSTQINQE